MKAMVTYERPTNWTKANIYKYLVFIKPKKQKWCVKVLQALLTLWMPWKHSKLAVPCVSQILTKN